GGGAGGVPGLIETALVTAIPVLIGFLAALLGIGGLADKVKKLFQSLSKPVMKAVDWVVDKIVAFGKKLWAKLRGRGGARSGADDPATRARREQDALAAADRVLAGHPTRAAVDRQIPALSRRHSVPLRLVVERLDPGGDLVHVQTARTGTHGLAGIDPAKLARLAPLQQRFIALITANGGDSGKAARVCEFKPQRGAAVAALDAAIDDFLRDLEKRAIEVVDRGGFQRAVNDDMRRAGIAFALQRRGINGSPTEFTNNYEYFQTQWRERYEDEVERQQRDVDAGLRRQIDRSEAARNAAASVSGSGPAIARRLERERAQVRAEGRGGATAEPTLTDAALITRVRAQASVLTFSTATAAAYHARKHGSEVPENERRGRVPVAWYIQAARGAVAHDPAPRVTPMGHGTRQLVFVRNVVDPNGDPVALSAMVFARHDGRVVMATFGSFL
ncbi:MAG: hypothetical protein ACT4NY_33965, partial [Pseudonocardiales bacterium]